MRTIRALPIAALLLLPAPLAAQGGSPARLTLEIAQPGFAGGISDTATPRTYVRPLTPRMYTLRYTRGWLGVGLTLATAATELSQAGVALLLKSDITVAEFAPEVRWPLWRNGSGTELRVHAGPTFALWSTNGYGQVGRIGAQAGASLHLPVSGRWGIGIRGDVTLSDTQVASDRLDPDLSNHPLWRTRIGLGLSYRLSSGP